MPAMPYKIGRCRRSFGAFIWIGIAVFLMTLCGLSQSDSGSYRASKHADPLNGVARDPNLPRGNCSQCHFNHGGEVPFDYALFTLNDNLLCQSSGCHEYASQWPPGDYYWPYPGNTPDWYNSGHGRSTASFPPAGQSEVRLCLQCHNPHGNADSIYGTYPSATKYLEEKGCYSNGGIPGEGCHGSNTANRPFGALDIYSQIQKLSRHAVETTFKKHSSDWLPNYPYGRESRQISSGSFSGLNRHIECVDCHNPHKAISGNHQIGTNYIGGPLLGSWGVEPFNGPGWTAPLNFTTVEFNSIMSSKEYQLCFKCHSYFAFANNPPTGSTDISLELNPANLSFHPVEDFIPENSYTSPSLNNGLMETMEFPWDNGMHDLMTCSDCHGSESIIDPRGPHGSNEPHILIASSSTSDDDLCLKCHKSSVYKLLIDPGENETGSRFDRQSTGEDKASHYFHVTEKRIACRQCHAARQLPPPPEGHQETPYPIEIGSVHGSNSFPGFLNGANIISYLPGRCTPSCHEGKSYNGGPE
jgi:hypothetical protein